MSMNCPACLTENADDHKFCKECGTRLGLAADIADESGEIKRKAMALNAQGLLEESLEKLQRAVMMNPADVTAYCNLANLHYKRGDVEKAVQCVEKALEIDPNRFKSLMLAGNLYGDAVRDHGKAIHYYERAARLEPTHPDLFNNLGNTYRFSGKHEKAREQFEKAIALNPKHARALFNLAKTHISLSQLEEAAEAYEKAIAIDAHHAKAHESLASLYLDLGREAEAIAALKEALELQPDSVELYVTLARLELKNDRPGKARALLKEALLIEPEHAEANKMRALI